MFTKSIRGRLLLWHGLILTIVVMGFGYTAYRLEYADHMRRIDDELQQRSFLLTRGLPVPPDLSTSPPGTGGLDDAGPHPSDATLGMPPHIARLYTGTNEFYHVVWLPDGRVQARSANAPENLEMPKRERPDQWRFARLRGTMREYIRFTSLDRAILMGCSVGYDLAELRQRAWLLVLAGASVLVLGVAGGWWVATRAIRPIDDISTTAAKIAGGDLSQRINADTDNELGRLAGVLNSTFARLESAFAQQKQFTADASHELRTPLAVLISEAQTTLARKRTAEEYRETVEACLETAQQMRQLTESLLALTRFDAGQEQLQHQTFDLAETARAVIESIHPLADKRGIRIHSQLAPVELTGDPTCLSQVISNLLTNAIHYNKTQGEIQISTRAENHAAILTVTDTGPGIASEDLPHIFERFYRADKSRSHTNAHSGLGLAICLAIVEAHGGSIKARSTSGVGTEFTVTLPQTKVP